MNWETVSNYYSGQGVVLLGIRDAITGAGNKFLPLGNSSDAKISVSTSVIEHKESQSGIRGIDLRLTTEIKANASITMESWNPKNLAIALRGSQAPVTAGTVTAETNKAYLGYVMPLAHVKVAALVIKKGATTLVEYVAGTGTAVDGQWDYKANKEAGSILWATTPFLVTLVDADTISCAYTYVGQNVVQALDQPAGDVYLRFEGLNTADGNKPVVVDVFRFATDPLKELSLISDTVQQFVLEGAVLYDALQTGSKYFKQTTVA